jgi:iron uptake system EfeUOB component EfeO/EfeM
MDSIDIVFEEIKFSIEQLEEILTRKLDRVKDDVRNLEDSFESYKRSTKRDLREIKQNISTIRDDINTLNTTVFPPVEDDEKKK